MAKEGKLFFRTEKPLEDTIREFLKNKVDRNQTEFMQDSIVLTLLAINKDYFLETYARKLEENSEYNSRLKVLAKMAELLDHYIEDEDVFITSAGDKLHLDELLAKGYRLEGDKLVTGPF